ncbi:hypothetical protein [Aureimonas psammosilenae]|uniref:hypothetical protein n=1 Tax=Aureimonas psammosilenae TaxID=2495496 RepID=UPI0012609AD6|nr:hypothetical protein [Aureimonas psammosilenae]
MATKPQAAYDRIAAANNGPYNASTNPGGLADGGHRQNWNADMKAVVDVADYAADLAVEVAADADRFEAAVAAIEAGPVTSVNGLSGAVVLPKIAPIALSVPAAGAVVTPMQTFRATLAGYAADTIGYYSDYAIPQASRTLNVYQASAPNVIFKTVTVSGAGNSIDSNLQSLGLAVSTNYLAELVFTDATGASVKTPKVAFTTPAQFLPDIGGGYGGGFFMGTYTDGSTRYAAIRAPKASGFLTPATWATAAGVTGQTGAGYGPSNSAALNSASYPSAQFCENLTINGLSDWYLAPAAEAAFHQKAMYVAAQNNAAFASGGAEYHNPALGNWTATEVDSSQAQFARASSSADATLLSGTKTSNASTIAVRRVAI